MGKVYQVKREGLSHLLHKFWMEVENIYIETLCINICYL